MPLRYDNDDELEEHDLLTIQRRYRTSKSNFAFSLALAALILMSAVVITALGSTGNSNRSQSAWASTFPGSNGQIAFTSNRDNPDTFHDVSREIYIMNADGSRQTPLTKDISGIKTDASWSPDGTKIAFTRSEEASEIYVMNADGSSKTNISAIAGIDGTSPSWSPDGTKIAFLSFGVGAEPRLFLDIFVMNADGSGLKKLTNSVAVTDAPSSPSWSPNGAKIAFSSMRDGNNGIFVMNSADGTGLTNLSKASGVPGLEPSWSPDGTKIAFSGGFDTSQIYVMNAADGTGLKNLSNNNSHFDVSPSWSPDGSRIAFTSSRDGNFEIYVMNAADGAGQTNLTKNPADDMEPDWGVHPASPPQYDLKINSVDLSGNAVSGIWTVIRSASDGAIVKTGFTPLSFAGDIGTEYKVSVANYDGKVFSRWEDGSTSAIRKIIVTAGNDAITTTTSTNTKTVTAFYDTGDSLRGFSPLTFAGADQQPDLTVNALSLDGSQTLHMWTIIDPQSASVSGTMTYKVYAGNYKSLVFDHWSDGNKDRIRTLSISHDTTLTAYYVTPPPITTVAFQTLDCGAGNGCGVGTITCADGSVTGPQSPIFQFTASKIGNAAATGNWQSLLGGALIPAEGGTINELTITSRDGGNNNHFVAHGNWAGSTGADPTKSTFICGGTPVEHSVVSISGDCGANEVKFEATNGVRATFQGSVACTP